MEKIVEQARKIHFKNLEIYNEDKKGAQVLIKTKGGAFVNPIDFRWEEIKRWITSFELDKNGGLILKTDR